MESRLRVPRAGGRGNGEKLLKGSGVCFWSDENIVQLDRAGDCTAS